MIKLFSTKAHWILLLLALISSSWSGESITPLPLKVEYDKKMATLGKKLFFDTAFSSTNTISCASCHQPKFGGADRGKFSVGIKGQLSDFNTPTFFNSAYNFRQFWDGRAPNLIEQAKGPIHNPKEMGTTFPKIIEKLKANPQYVQEFNQVFSDGIDGR